MRGQKWALIGCVLLIYLWVFGAIAAHAQLTQPDQTPRPGTPVNTSHCLGDLRLAWNMNEGAGTTVYDASRAGSNGTLSSVAWVLDSRGPALDFDSTSDTVTTTFTPGTSHTVAVWINPSSNTNNTFYWSASTSNHSYLAIWNDRYNYLGNGFDMYTTTPALSLGEWQHIVCVTSVEDDYARVYGAGVLTEEDADIDTPTMSVFRAGDSGSTNSASFELATVQIWSRALTANEVLSLYLDSYQMFRPSVSVAQVGTIIAANAGGGGAGIPLIQHHYNLLNQ